MESLVSIIEKVENNISELKEMAKKNARDLAAVLQEKENIASNLAMFEKVLEDLTRTKNNEIQVVMAEPKDQPVVNLEKGETEKKHISGIREPLHINAIDENGDVIAEYFSTIKAAEDLKISSSNVSYRIAKVPIERQIQKHGYALIKV